MNPTIEANSSSKEDFSYISLSLFSLGCRTFLASFDFASNRLQ